MNFNKTVNNQHTKATISFAYPLSMVVLP